MVGVVVVVSCPAYFFSGGWRVLRYLFVLLLVLEGQGLFCASLGNGFVPRLVHSFEASCVLYTNTTLRYSLVCHESNNFMDILQPFTILRLVVSPTLQVHYL